MAKKRPPPASDQDGWEPAHIELGPEGFLRHLEKIPPADRKRWLAGAGLVEQSQGKDKTQIGRPPDFPELVAMIQFYLANKKALALTDEAFKEMVEATYRYLDKRGTRPGTITNYLQAARREATRREAARRGK
jgi:hypothetical protein